MTEPLSPADPGKSLRLQILGPLRLWHGDRELDPGPRQQARLLGLLLARVGQPVNVGDLVDLLWGEHVPATALNVIHKYVGALRRLLEPSLPVRATGSYLLRRPHGYLFVAGPGLLDLLTFRQLVEAAGSERRAEPALERYEQALGLWGGHAGSGLEYGPDATSIFAALDIEFFDACTAAAELAVSLGRPERVLSALRLAGAMGPLHEPVQASLVAALGAAGQQAEALEMARTVRARLAEELGIEPGPALQEAHQRVLNQRLNPPARPATVRRSPAPVPVAPDRPASQAGHLVGRDEELAALHQVIDRAAARGAGLALVEGEPGAGKTRLLEEIGTEADWRGALVVWGRCLEGAAAPSMWPWTEVIEALLGTLSPETRDERLAGELGRLVEPRHGAAAGPAPTDRGAQFRLFEQVVTVVGEVAAKRPVVLIVDDLQWADVASVRLFSHLAAVLPAGAVLVGALRDRAPAPGSELSRMLAAAARVPGHRRIPVGPLEPAEIAELIRRDTGKVPAAVVVRAIHARTAGNPFFVRELARLLTEDGTLAQESAARAAVPSSVRDIVRDRVSTLDDGARDLLQAAALVGRDVNVSVLAGAADIDMQTLLERLEQLQVLDLLRPVPGDPFLFRFAHDLVRQSVVETTPQRRATALHLRVADALESTGAAGGSDVERLAFHLWAAGPLADPARTASALVRAGRRAAAKTALESAERQLRSAIQVARRGGLTELELAALSQLITVIGMRSGYTGAAPELLERAEHLANGLGREQEAAVYLFSRLLGASHVIQTDRVGRLARRLYELGKASSDELVRAYGLYAWSVYQRDLGHIGEAYRLLLQGNEITLGHASRPGDDPLRHHLDFNWPVWHAKLAVMFGDVDAARAVSDSVEAAVAGDPYETARWAYHTSLAAAMAGDPLWARSTAERGIAVDPHRSFDHLQSYLGVILCWARGLTDDDPAAAAAEAETILSTRLLDPPRTGIGVYLALTAELWLTAGRPDRAGAALDRAEHLLDTFGQRYPEGMVLLLRARLSQARGEPLAVVRAAAEKARAVSTEREAHLFAARAERFLAELGDR